MRQETTRLGETARALRRFAAALALGAVVASHAAPARANNDFQNGFEDQLGRIAAWSVTALGVRVLTGGTPPAAVYAPPPVYVAPVYYAPQPVYYAPPVVYAPRPVHYYAGPKKVKVRQVVYYPSGPRHGRWDHGPRGGHGGTERGHGRGGW